MHAKFDIDLFDHKYQRQYSKTQQVKIKELEDRDYETVVDLLKQLGYENNDAASLSDRYVVFKKHEGIVFVVEDDDNTVVGFAAVTIMPLIHCDGLLGRIAGICVDEKSRSSGFGAALIRFIENYCIQKDCVLLEVTTNLARTEAHQFYLNNGFVETHKRYHKNLETHA